MVVDGVGRGVALPPPKNENMPLSDCVNWSKKLGEVVSVAGACVEGVVTATRVLLGSGLICLAVTTRRLSDVPGGEQVTRVSVGVLVGLSTPTSVGSTILVLVTS